ncbi:MAG TPA: aldo/keto reductase [Bacteroidia bacterium]|nr:aldo/keto reductase [Bacteroidia bacterium]
MHYRRLGKSGLQVSALSFGSWITFGAQIDDQVAGRLMQMAYDAGVNFFDNAETYAGGKSEIVMGNILKKMEWDRTSFIVSSKVFWGGKKPNQTGLSRKHIFEACHSALRRLQVDYLDLYFCHRPDANTPIEETVRAMHDLISQGKVLYWGTSEWSAEAILEAYAIADRHHLYAPTMEQPQYNILHREKFEKEYEPVFRTRGLGSTIWSPLASGLLTGKYNDAIPGDTRISRPDLQWLKERIAGSEAGPKIEKIKKFSALAKESGTTSAKLAIAWTLKNPNVSTAILGASRPEQLEESLRSLEALSLLTDDLMAKIDDIFSDHPEIF